MITMADGGGGQLDLVSEIIKVLFSMRSFSEKVDIVLKKKKVS